VAWTRRVKAEPARRRAPNARVLLHGVFSSLYSMLHETGLDARKSAGCWRCEADGTRESAFDPLRAKSRASPAARAKLSMAKSPPATLLSRVALAALYIPCPVSSTS
jgi:hypothetical protein